LVVLGVELRALGLAGQVLYHFEPLCESNHRIRVRDSQHRGAWGETRRKGQEQGDRESESHGKCSVRCLHKDEDKD
jgi:hypothetical protein